MTDEQEALMRNSEPVTDHEKEPKEIEACENDRPLRERWENWATVVDR